MTTFRHSYPLTLPPGRYELDGAVAQAWGVKAFLAMDGYAAAGATNQLTNIYDYARKVFLSANGDASNAGSGIGPAGRMYNGKTNRWILVASDCRNLFGVTTLNQVTIALIRRKTDTTARSQYTIGTTTASARCGFHLPWSDGNVYWDYGGTSVGAGRLTWTGYTRATNVERWLFHAGTRGRAIWFDGVSRQSSTSDATAWAIPTSTSFRLNNIAGDTNSGDEQEFYQLIIADRQWGDGEIVSWFDNPWQMMKEGRPLRRTSFAGTSPPPPPPSTYIGARFQMIGSGIQQFSGGRAA